MLLMLKYIHLFCVFDLSPVYKYTLRSTHRYFKISLLKTDPDVYKTKRPKTAELHIQLHTC